MQRCAMQVDAGANRIVMACSAEVTDRRSGPRGSRIYRGRQRVKEPRIADHIRSTDVTPQGRASRVETDHSRREPFLTAANIRPRCCRPTLYDVWDVFQSISTTCHAPEFAPVPSKNGFVRRRNAQRGITGDLQSIMLGTVGRRPAGGIRWKYALHFDGAPFC
jgi:hypothetical protein